MELSRRERIAKRSLEWIREAYTRQETPGKRTEMDEFAKEYFDAILGDDGLAGSYYARFQSRINGRKDGQMRDKE